MSILDANVRTTEGLHDFYQTLPCQIKCLCSYMDLNNYSIIDAGSGKEVIAKQVKKSFKKATVVTSEKNSSIPDTEINEFNFKSDKNIVDKNVFPTPDYGDFLTVKDHFTYTISNPPYSEKDNFISHALEISDHIVMLFPLQVLNYIDFCEKWLDNEKYCGRILMFPKVILNPEGTYIQGGNTGYAWFHWSNYLSSVPSYEKYEIIEDIRKFK